MKKYKNAILENLCSVELAYRRINKKLDLDLSNSKIEELIFFIIKETPINCFVKKGKNIYILNYNKNIRLTVNSNTNRVITGDNLISQFSSFFKK